MGLELDIMSAPLPLREMAATAARSKPPGSVPCG